MKEPSEIQNYDLSQIDEYRKSHNTSVLAIMFTDIEGFTAYTNREGDIAGAKMIAEHDDIVKSAIAENDGIPIQKIGDSFLSIFADPSLAVKSALAIQQNLKNVNFVLKVRIGIHLGQIALKHDISTDIFGNHVNIASRIESLAKGGQIFLSRSVYDSAHSWVRSEYIKYKYHGKVKLKGIASKEDVYQVGFEGDDFSGVEKIKKDKLINTLKIASMVLIFICVSATVPYLFVKKEKPDIREKKQKMLIELWSSDKNHQIPFLEKYCKIWSGTGNSSEPFVFHSVEEDFSRVSINEIMDKNLINELDDSAVKKMYIDFKIHINNNYDVQAVANRFVFEDDMIEKGFLDTFELGDNIPLSTLKSVDCDGFLFCELFKSPYSADTLYYYYECSPHLITYPDLTIGFFGISTDSEEIFSEILSHIETFGRRIFPLGKIISINKDLCYIKNEYRVKQHIIGKYLTFIERRTDESYLMLPYTLEVKTVSDSMITALIVQKTAKTESDSNLTIKTGDLVDVAIKDIGLYDTHEICSYWPWYAGEVGKLLISQGKYDDALKIYGDHYRVLLEKKNFAYSLNDYAATWASIGKNLKSALKAAKKSLELKDDHNTWDTLSLIYWKMSKYQEAIEAEEKALQLAGGNNEEYEKRISDIKAEMEEKGK